jgi:hypothetical protein
MNRGISLPCILLKLPRNASNKLPFLESLEDGAIKLSQNDSSEIEFF